MSGRRLSVNFSSLAMKEKIMRIADKNKISASKLIEELIMFRFFDYEKTDAIKDFIKDGNFVVSRNMVESEKFESAMKRSKFRYGRSIKGERGDLSKFIIEDVSSCDIHGFEEYSHQYNKLSDVICKAVQRDIERMTANDWMNNFFTSCNANLTLVFIEKIDVDFLYNPMIKQLEINYRCNDIYMIPFVFDELNDNDFVRYLDFNYIRYKTFNSYVKGGWDRRKHSHLLYIDRASKSNTAGFFIGVTYEDNGLIRDENSRQPLDRYMTSTKIYYAHRPLKINKWHIMSEDELNNIDLFGDFARRMEVINKRHNR
ncbi:hypothetical protein C9426_33465 [Serratia sp. S1B]|nr:hypothetical protein C9426_33465 [Serratia sp. S1B]